MKKHIATLVCSLMVLPVHAQWAVFDLAVEQSVASAQTAIVSAIQSLSQQQVTAQITELSKSTSTIDQNQSDLVKAGNESKYQVGDGCAVMAAAATNAAIMNPGGGANGGGRGSGGSLGGSATRSGGTVSLQTDLITKVIGGSKGLVPPPAPEVQAANAVKLACDMFAIGLRATNCVGAQFKPGLSSKLPNADIMSNTLFDGPQSVEIRNDPTTSTAIRKHYTFTRGTVDGYAIEAYQRNLGTPIEPSQLSTSELSSEAGRQYLSFKDSYDARISMAERPVNEIVRNRIASTDTIGYLQTLSQPDSTAMLPVLLPSGGTGGPWLSTYLAENMPNWQTTGISKDEMTNIEVMRRYGNTGWHLQVHNGFTPEAVVKEQLEMQSFQTALLWRLIQSLETMSAVNGQAAAAAIRTEMTPQLNSLHTAAAAR